MSNTYTPLSRAGFEAIGIKRRRKGANCRMIDHFGTGQCPGCIGPDITGVLANDPPARNQADVEAAVEWLGSRDILAPDGVTGRGNIHTRLLVIEPREFIGMTIDNYGETLLFSNPPVFDGLIIVGGEQPLNPDHVAHLIEQAESAGVPVWLDWGVWMPRQEWENNPEIVLPDDYAVDRVRDDPDMVHIDADFGYHVMHRVKREEFLMPSTLENKSYRQLPAAMGGV